MKLKHILILTAMTGVVAAGPGRPGFAGAPEWVDVNGNGQIDPDEREAFGKLRMEAAKALADRADANSDGVVDEAERQNMIAAMNANVEEIRRQLFAAVAGEDGKISLEEFQKIHPVGHLPERVVNRLFGLLDVTGGEDGGPDGFVTEDEFLASLNPPEEPGEPGAP